MSLTQYKNIADIFNSKLPSFGSFFTKTQLKLLTPTIFYPNLDANERFVGRDSVYSSQKVELHLYSMNGAYIAGNPYTLNYQPIDAETIVFDIESDLSDLGIQSGIYRFSYNILRDHVGSFATPKLFIYDISPSRTELILKLEAPDDAESIKQLAKFYRYWASQRLYFINGVLNFGKNHLIPIANINTDNVQNKIYIKLFDPLPPGFIVQTSCWISEMLAPPYIDSIQIVPPAVNIPTSTLRGPQTDIEKLYWSHVESDYKTWTDIVSTNTDIKDRTLNNLFKKKYGIKLNIDFSDFSTFVHFSSLEERILNFTYKVELIAWYQDQIDAIYNLDSTHTPDILLYANAKNSLLQSFDEFEEFLYYERTSLKRDNAVYTITPVPKYTKQTDLEPIKWIDWAQTWVNANVIWKIGPGTPTGFDIIDVYTEEYLAWKSDSIQTAKEYDLTNDAQLIRTIPEFIRDTEENSEYVLFVNMMAQYFDTIWMYMRHFSDKYAADEHPDFGISKDLLLHMANNHGWKLNESNKVKDLWFYFFGLDDVNKLTRTNVTDDSFALSSSDYTKAIWKRIFLNLPALLKSKGSSRSIQALLSAYGIPSSHFFVREFGGPGNQDLRPKHKEEKLVRYLDLAKDEYFEFPYLQFADYSGSLSYPNTMYFRFITDPATFTTASIFSKNNKIKIQFEKSGSTVYTGNIKLIVSSSLGIISSSIQNIEYLDELPSTIFLQTNTIVSHSAQSASLDLYFLQKKYDKVNIFESTSLNIHGAHTTALISDDTIRVCEDGLAKYYLNEFRYWKYPLETEIMKSHMLSPNSYHGNNVTHSTYELVARYPVWLEDAYTGVVLKPITVGNFNQSSSYNSELNLTRPSASIVAYSEYARFEIPTLGDNPIIPEKERVETSTLIGNLSYNTRVELSSYDFKPNDENKIKIGFSPQFNINEDIFNRFGTFNLDEYIGSPLESNKKYYSKLLDLAKFYYKESQTTDDIINYLKALKIYDFTIFEQIKQIVPAKANAIIGLIIENNELQRIKLKFLPIMSATFDQSNTADFVRNTVRTATLSDFKGSIKQQDIIHITSSTPPSAIIDKQYTFENTFVHLTGSIFPVENIASVFSSKTEYNSTITIVPLLSKKSKNKKIKINNFVDSVYNQDISSSYTSPILGRQLGYENLDYTGEINPITIIDTGTFNFYYGELEYSYPNDASASLNKFTEATITFGKNPFTIKRINKGAENHRYYGAKHSSPDVNVINAQYPGQSFAVPVSVIPSGSLFVNYSSSISDNQNNNVFIDPNTLPPGV